ncbi:MAG: hypothetical protein NTZ33_01955 [Bacteroidetes bacterium]|nr:hypothetical protein [Bacteroidota bacterium]
MQKDNNRYEKPELTEVNNRRKLSGIKIKYLYRGIFITVCIYLLMLIPVFFLYPNYNQPIKENFDPLWLTNISSKLEGDCYRKTRNFIRECPFPCREIHLNSEHTLVEIEINNKWIAYDPCFNLLFNGQNIVQLSADVNRGYTPPYLITYPYKNALKKFRYYHNFYFALLNVTHPFYYKILRTYYICVSR